MSPMPRFEDEMALVRGSPVREKIVVTLYFSPYQRPSMLLESLGVSEATLYQSLKKLVDAGLAKKSGSRKQMVYLLTEEGQAVAKQLLESKKGALAEKRLYEVPAPEYGDKGNEVLKLPRDASKKRDSARSLEEQLSGFSLHKFSISEEPIRVPLGLGDAFVCAHIIAPHTDVVTGRSVTLEIMVANLGKRNAFLTKIEGIFPRGFDVVQTPDEYKVNEQSLDLGRELVAPLQTFKIKLVLRPRKSGKYVLTPKIQFVTEAGDLDSCDLQQVTLNVRELERR